MAKRGEATFIASGKGLIVTLLVVVATAVWMFILGIWVGRETAPIRFRIHNVQTELSELENTDSPSKPPLDEGADIGEKRAALDFYEELKGKKARLPAPAPKPEGKSEKSSPAKASAAKASAAKVKKRRVPLKQKAKSTLEPATAQVPSSPPKPAKSAEKIEKTEPKNESGSAPYTIQVASVTASAAADKIVGNLKDSGVDAFHIKTLIPGKGTWYRVRVGHYREKKSAAAMVDRLKKMNFQPMVVKK